MSMARSLGWLGGPGGVSSRIPCCGIGRCRKVTVIQQQGPQKQGPSHHTCVATGLWAQPSPPGSNPTFFSSFSRGCKSFCCAWLAIERGSNDGEGHDAEYQQMLKCSNAQMPKCHGGQGKQARRVHVQAFIRLADPGSLPPAGCSSAHGIATPPNMHRHFHLLGPIQPVRELSTELFPSS